MENIVLLNLILLNMNTDDGIRSGVRVTDEMPKTLMVARGLLPSEWGQDISLKKRSLLSVLAMARKAVIAGAMEGDCYSYHTM